MKYFLHILIPSFGPSPFLDETIRSVLANKALFDCKITVVDDASPTDQIKLLVQRKFPDVEYTRNKVNLGVGGNFNRCLELSEGKLTLIIGSDDRLLPNFLERLADAHSRNPKAAIFHLGATVINEKGQASKTLTDLIKSKIKPSIRNGTCIEGTEVVRSLLVGNWSYFPAIAWNTKIIRNYKWETKYQLAVDLDMLLKLAIANEKFCLLSGVQFEYRRHSQNVSKLMINSGDRISEELDVYSAIYKKTKFLKNPVIKLLAVIAITARANALYSGLLLFLKDPFSGVKLIFKSLSLRNYVFGKQ